MSNSNDNAANEPQPKKLRTESEAPAVMQTNLFAFFASNVPTPPKKRMAKSNATIVEAKKSSAQEIVVVPEGSGHGSTISAGGTTKGSRTDSNDPSNVCCSSTSHSSSTTNTVIPDPMIPTPTPTPRSITWQSYHDNFVLVRQPAPSLFSKSSNIRTSDPRTKVAAIDLDGTLVVWRCSGYPSVLSHYELWNTTVPTKLRHLYDDGYQLIIISNQAAIQKAHSGKKAQLVKDVMNWIAALVNRPIYAVISTQSSKKFPGSSFHKPSSSLWKVAQKRLGGPQDWDVASSFFVGDSADPNDPQGGVDAKFAENVGDLYDGTPLKFFTPIEFFGPSDSERRQRQKQLQSPGSLSRPPVTALQARSALLGGYWQAPILLILCGVQGSGKSTFCEMLLAKSMSTLPSQTQQKWVHLSQDTIQNGKPGKREQVEDAARAALQKGSCVVIDRMHLTPEQRSHFVKIGVDESVPIHVVVFNPPRSVILKRVRERTFHPGKVQGEDGVRRTLQSLDQMILPTYSTVNDGITLISCASTPWAVSRLIHLYAKADLVPYPSSTSATVTLPAGIDSEMVDLPTLSLGTMGIGKRIAAETIERAASSGFCAIDTAPSYNNQDKVGEALSRNDNRMFCIAKLPKNVVQSDQVRTALSSTLDELQRSSVDLLLLHWPCDVMEAGTLVDVWREMEACCREGQCKALGVCNFNVTALSQLLAQAVVSIPPVVNQVERHPLLAQWDLVDFCEQQNIHIQAHTPLGQGKDLLLGNRVVQEVAAETQTSPAAVVLQWNLQQGVSVVPKCRSEAHMHDVFRRKRLTPEQMSRLDTLDCGKRFVAPPFMYGSAPYCWN